MPKYVNEIGKKYNNLIVVDKAPSQNGRKYWVCECKHCHRQYTYSGTKLRQGIAKCSYCSHYGEKYGSFTIGEYKYTSDDRHHYVECICDCGNHEIVRLSDVISGKKIKCYNCYKKESIQYFDETGNKYGKLTVIKKDLSKQSKNAYWICKCDCGNTVSVSGLKLRDGTTKSCGCLKSAGEEKIIQLLKDNNIQFKTQITFNDCKDISLLKFDFGIIQNKKLLYLIEYDGQQHYNYTNNGWNNKENYEKVKNHDNIKNQYCLSHHIPLIRIPYYIYQTLDINDLLLEKTNYLIKE